MKEQNTAVHRLDFARWWQGDEEGEDEDGHSYDSGLGKDILDTNSAAAIHTLRSSFNPRGWEKCLS